MSLLNPALFNSSSGSGNGDGETIDISNSGAFIAENNTYLAKTFSAEGDRRTWSYSFWMKRTSMGVHEAVLSCTPAANYFTNLYIDASSHAELFHRESTSNSWVIDTIEELRDVSEWYHVLMVCDTTETIEIDRFKVYINGIQQIQSEVSLGYRAINAQQYINVTTAPHYIGSYLGSLNFLNGYIAEVNFIDGQALTPDDFAKTDSINGQWNPISYAGTYGTNGFYLNFQNGSNLGEDSSGNNNDFTNTGVVQSTDTPTNNQSILSVIDSVGVSLLKTGLAVSMTNGDFVKSTIATGTSGKWYYELEALSNSSSGAPIAWGLSSTRDSAGVSFPSEIYRAVTIYLNNLSTSGFNLTTDGVNNSTTITGTPIVIGDILQLAYDADTGEVWFGLNNSWWDGGSTFTGNPSTQSNPCKTFSDIGLAMIPYIPNTGSTYTVKAIFNSDDFVYTPPTGYKSICSKNLAEPDILIPTDYFNTLLYTGNGTEQRVGADIQDVDLYPLANSARFEYENSQYLTRTPSQTSTNLDVLTFSTWVKRANLDTFQGILCSRNDDSGVNSYPYTILGINTDGTLSIDESYNNILQFSKHTTMMLNDVNHYYHIVVSIDTDNVVPEDRVKLFIDGELITSFATSIDAPIGLNITAQLQHVMTLGCNISAPGFLQNLFYSGYMSEAVFVDGQALTSDAFGQKDPNGIWIPKQYTGTYGINGFHLDFSNNADLGEDSSGNSNDWTNINTVSQSIDTPSNNYAILNDNKAHLASSITDAGLTAVLANQSGGRAVHCTFPISSGKWYAEMEVITNGGNRAGFGIIPNDQLTTDYAGRMSGGITYTSVGNYHYDDATIIDSSPNAYTTGDIIGVHIDLDNNILEYFKNNVSQGIINGYLNGSNYVLSLDNVGNVVSTSVELTLHITEDSWSYTPPEGFLALSSNNLPIPSVIGQPDLIWIKNRTITQNHNIFDTERSPRLLERAAFGGSLATVYNLTINADTQNYLLFNETKLLGYDGDEYCTVNLTVTNNAVVGSFSTSVPALDLRGFPVGCDLNITVDAGCYVVGAGGRGGSGSPWNLNGLPGNPGGDAIWANSDINITNNGIIAGGGGGGGGADGTTTPSGSAGYGGGGGGGGAGNIVGPGGPGGGSTHNGISGLSGTLTTGGTGGDGNTTAAAGGTGGTLGNNGSVGGNSPPAWNGTNYAGGAGGVAGFYSDGDKYITWSGVGSQLGSINLEVLNSTGSYPVLRTDTTDDEEITASPSLISIYSQGIDIGPDVNVNTNASEYAAWLWKKGITPGLDIVNFDASVSTTIPHNLNSIPQFIITKSRTVDGTGWIVYHNYTGANKYLYLNTDAAAITNSTVWLNTEPTSSNFTNGQTTYGEQIAYLFSAVAGFSTFGAYTGNGSSDGPFTYLGFKPAFIMIKSATSTSNWEMLDSIRDVDNDVFLDLSANNSNSENLIDGTSIDFLSNGFKLRDGNSTGTKNANGQIYIYAAFAENPFKYTRAR